MNTFTTRLLAFIAGTLLACSTATADVWHAAYGVAKTFDFTLYNADGTLDVDEVDGGTEVTIDCNGTPATATNDFADEGSFYSISVTAAELQCQRTTITVAATLTSVFFVETCGHASAFNISLCWETGDTFARVGAAGASLTAVADQVWDEDATGHQTTGTFGQAIGDPVADTNTIYKAVVTDATGATVGVDVVAMKVDTAAILVDTGTTLDDFLDTEVAAILSDTNAILVDTSTTLDDFIDTEVATLLEALIVLGAEQTADSGTTSTAVDAALTQATNDWFKGAGIHFTSGTLLGQMACVTAFTAASDTLTFAPVVTTAVVAHTYYLTPDECQTGDVFARVGAPAGASVSADVAAVKAETATIVADTNEVQISLAAGGLIESLVDDIGAAGAGLTAADDAVIALVDDIGVAGAGLSAIPDQSINLTGNLTGNVTGSVGSVTGAVGSVTGAVGSVTGAVGSVTGAVGSVTGNVGGNVTGSVASVINLEQTALLDSAFINCTVNTAFFAGSSTTVACILTDRDGGAVTVASSDMTGLELRVLSGAQLYEGRFINSTTWDAGNSELRLTLSRALPATLADAVTAIIR